MGVSVGGGGGRGRKVYAELNLVPFIDLLSVCIVFLIAMMVAMVVEAGLCLPRPVRPSGARL